ncbi:hypothetical protein [Nostoc sp. FACHB-145]|uniref:hypothetical protein n=1 Tax=Nostoc sp. FACHB-145 TaxID=2692836 RepID=UPI001689859C|nr:hypothetical protein [Nostoc sp. FACHB-145]MBD2472166.1 hypothetical protein [Nostoc sp. FACHB-145]
MSANQTSTLEKIRAINPGGISDNMMIARLSRALNQSTTQQKNLSITPPHQETDSNRQQQAREELGHLLLSKGNIEDYKQQLKQQYVQQYLIAFGLERTQLQESQTNQRLITQLQQFREIQKAVLSPSERNNSSRKPIELTTNPPENTQNQESDKKSFIRVVLDKIITKGRSLGNQISAFENQGYKALLKVDDTKQILSIDRLQPQPEQSNPAFKAEKLGASDFQILEDNLTEQETQDIIAPNQQQIQLPQPQIQPKRDLKNNGLEID